MDWHQAWGTAMTFRFMSLVALALGGIVALSAAGSAQEAIFIARHTDPPPVLSFDEILDETPLSESGEQRAKLLAERLKDVGISAIYATETVRTQQTATPLAKTLGLEVRIHPLEDVDGLVKLLRSEHQGDRILVVGHWSTIPLIVKALGHGEEVKIERSAYDNLFVVIPKGDQAPTVLHLHY
jgi:broad specificity phosphatase PhoE